MKKFFEEPDLEVVNLQIEDVITTSYPGMDEDEGERV